MQNKYIDILNSFDIGSIPDLDIVVLGALQLFSSKDLPQVDISKFKRPLIVGSGNAEATGRILFEETEAIFASESSFEEKLAAIPDIDEVVIVSASGGKHAPIIATKAKESGKHVTLITNTPNSPAANALGEGEFDEHIFPKNREPYTYNTSTYMGMILGVSGESASEIMQFIESNVAKIDFSVFSNYERFYLIVPPEFSGIIRMLQVKFIELFGRNIARDVETSEYVRHATTVAPSEELFISFGVENETWGKEDSRLYVPLPERAGYGSIMAVAYYTIAQIQKQKPAYFKQNIDDYTKFISGIFGETISPIVDGNNL